MATLEVHDDQGRVQFVELARDHPVLFGTSAACDVVLAGAEVRPVHGRIRWKKGRYRVEASPDAQFVVINGTRMTSSSLRQGDEMTVGGCRLFMLRVHEDLDRAESRAAAADRPRHADEERTRVLEGPPLQASQPLPLESRETRGARSVCAGPAPSPLERADWLDDLELDNASAAANHSFTPGQHGPGHGRGAGVGLGERARAWLRALRDERAQAPGRERLVSSPLVIGLLLAIGLLLLMGLGLRSIISRTLADQTYNRAMEVMEDGDSRTAIRDFDAFLAAYPRDPRAGKARVMRALANVRQYISVSGGTWTAALDAAREMLSTVGQEPAFRDERVELAELTIRIGEGLADRARHSADEKSLREAEAAVPLHAEIAGEPAPAFLKRSRLPGLLDDARAAVRKAKVRAIALVDMDTALQKGSASGVYKSRDALIDQYADLAQDRELVLRMTQANDLIRQSVKLNPERRGAETTERPTVLGPATSIVLRASNAAQTAPPNGNSMVYGLADGFAYALDGATGAPVWQRPVGLAAPFPPQAVPGDPTVLVVDARFHDLLRLNATSGALVWRQALDEPVESPPLVLGDQLFQVLPGGKLLVIALGTGERQRALELGLPLARAAVSDEQGRFLYVVGHRDCLFILARDPLACLGVEYLGHGDGSIPCAPARLGRFLVIVENDRPADSQWRVMVLDDDGARVRAVQRINVPGWTWGTPASSGSVLWAAGDKGGIEAYALGDYASKTPLSSLAKLNPDASSSGPALGVAVSERELWLSAGQTGHYELDPDRGQIAARTTFGQLGPALAPMQIVAGAPRRVVMTFQDPETGGAALYAVDAVTGSPVWQTVLGAPWPIPLTRAPRDQGLKTIGPTGRDAVISPERLRTGGFETQAISRPGEMKLPAGQVIAMNGAGEATEILSPDGGLNVVWVRERGKSNTWRKVELPTSLAAPPLAWGGNLLIPGVDGRAYLIDPVSARSRAEPLVPVFNRDRRGRWRKPFLLNTSSVILADSIGLVRRVALKPEPVPRLVVEAETSLDKDLIADPAATAGAVVVVTADQRVRALSVRDLSPIGAWPLEAPLVGQPVAAGDRCFVCDGGGGVMAVGPEGRRLWSIKLDAPASGSPVVVGETVWLLDRAGTLYGRSMADGAPRRQFDLGILPAGGMIVVGSQAMVPVARGTIQPLDLNSPGGARP